MQPNSLLLQGLFQLLEPAVTVRCRQQDLSLVKVFSRTLIIVKSFCALRTVHCKFQFTSVINQFHFYFIESKSCCNRGL